MIRLDEYDKVEWFDIARKLAPGLTEAEYNEMWVRFVAAKSEHEASRRMQ